MRRRKKLEDNVNEENNNNENNDEVNENEHPNLNPEAGDNEGNMAMSSDNPFILAWIDGVRNEINHQNNDVNATHDTTFITINN